MKKGLLIFTFAAMVAASACMITKATAQAPKIAPVTSTNGVISEPQTTVYVDLVIEKQDIIAGPYARYAQKYLGISAPLADKALYDIVSANISDSNALPTQNAVQTEPRAVSHTNPEYGFPKLSIDRTSSAAQSLEESARLAAARLFDIRKSRYELVTGEVGENVFGAGLAAAIDELNRLEEEYLALFLGKQTNSTIVKHYQITPAESRTTYVVCRFSLEEGVLPDEDLSGEPVVLEIDAPSATISTEGLNVSTRRPSTSDPGYRIAAEVECRLFFGGANITEAVIPVYQFGRTVVLAK